MTSNNNLTAEAIVERLPRKPLLSARDVADAIGAASTKPVIEAIEAGRLSAARPAGRYIISRNAAEKWICEGAL